MAVAYYWPSTLPACPNLDGYSESRGQMILRTPMDKGVSKQRRAGKRPDVLQVSYILTSEQVETLETFISLSLVGVRRFGYTHPRLLTPIEVRIIPSKEGEFYTVNALSPTLFKVGLQLEIMP